MTIRFEKIVPDLTQSEAKGKKEKHKIFKDGHYIGYIAVARRIPHLVCLSFQAEANQKFNKWWGEMSLEECKVFVTQQENEIKLHPDLQEHFDTVTATSPVC